MILVWTPSAQTKGCPKPSWSRSSTNRQMRSLIFSSSALSLKPHLWLGCAVESGWKDFAFPVRHLVSQPTTWLLLHNQHQSPDWRNRELNGGKIHSNHLVKWSQSSNARNALNGLSLSLCLFLACPACNKKLIGLRYRKIRSWLWRKTLHRQDAKKPQLMISAQGRALNLSKWSGKWCKDGLLHSRMHPRIQLAAAGFMPSLTYQKILKHIYIISHII